MQISAASPTAGSMEHGGGLSFFEMRATGSLIVDGWQGVHRVAKPRQLVER